MNTGNAFLELGNSTVVMNGIQKAGDQIEGFINAEVAHILQREMCFRTAKLGKIQHGLIDIQPTAAVATVDKVPNMRPGTACQVELARPCITEYRSEEHTSELQSRENLV